MITKKSTLRLTKLVNFLKSMSPEKFKYANILSQCNGTECGTVACAAGWLPSISSSFRWHNEGDEYHPYYSLQIKIYPKANEPTWIGWNGYHSNGGGNWTNVAKYFGILPLDARLLFEPHDATSAAWNVGFKIDKYSNNIEVADSIVRYMKYRAKH